MRTTDNYSVVCNFLDHKPSKSYSGNVSTNEDATKLYSYSTCMAEWHDGKLYINISKYSRTTSKQMSHLPSPNWCKGYDCVFVDTKSQYGLRSVWACYKMSVLAIDQKKHKAYYDFKKTAENFLKYRGDLLAEVTVNFLKTLLDSARKNSFKAQRNKFMLVSTGFENKHNNVLTRSFKDKKRMEYRMFDHSQRAFCF